MREFSDDLRPEQLIQILHEAGVPVQDSNGLTAPPEELSRRVKRLLLTMDRCFHQRRAQTAASSTSCDSSNFDTRPVPESPLADTRWLGCASHSDETLRTQSSHSTPVKDHSNPRDAALTAAQGVGRDALHR